MSLFAALAVTLLALVNVAATELSASGMLAPDCFCPLVFSPVCGVDGNDYSSSCFASCAGVQVAYSGGCAYGPGLFPRPLPRPPSCFCVPVYYPVCGMNGRTYRNPCQARCARVAIRYAGVCRVARPKPTPPPVVASPALRSPKPVSSPAPTPSPSPSPSPLACGCEGDEVRLVCSSGKTYLNSCEARCKDPEGSSTPGACAGDDGSSVGLKCGSARAPVCGDDGVTYQNNCTAAVAGVGVASTGECSTDIPGIPCPPPGPIASCIADPCQTSTSSCKGAPGVVCRTMTCGAPIIKYLGSKLVGNPCTAVYVNTTTRTVVDKCDAGPAPTPSPSPPACGCEGDEVRLVCSSGKTYLNSCEARCKDPEGLSTPGACEGDDGSSVGVKCSSARAPVCGDDGVTYQNNCTAAVAGVGVASTGECSTADIPSIPCPPPGPIASCIADPCQTSTSPCKGTAGVVCRPMYCGAPSIKYLGSTLVGNPCTAVYVNTTTRSVVDTCSVPVPA